MFKKVEPATSTHIKVRMEAIMKLLRKTPRTRSKRRNEVRELEKEKETSMKRANC
jgi:hypothetical protein